jgi:hypothetical protein
VALSGTLTLTFQTELHGAKQHRHTLCHWSKLPVVAEAFNIAAVQLAGSTGKVPPGQSLTATILDQCQFPKIGTL